MPRSLDRCRARSGGKLLARPAAFAEINYAVPTTTIDGYPAEASLFITSPGELNTIVFQQNLLFDDLLIRSTQST